MKPENLYHTGLIVEDVEGAKRWYSQVLGYKWCETASGEQVIRLAQGERTIRMVTAYSMSEPRIELVQSVPGTIWTPEKCGVHHLGYWSDDVDGELAVLLENGCEFEASSNGPDGSASWSYCRHSVWGRIELVSSSMRALLEQWFKTGKL